ncbi:MarR family winged helix-turn-helix transcriptional regulator [Solimonas marina]
MQYLHIQCLPKQTLHWQIVRREAAVATKHYDIKTFRSSESIGYLLKRAQARMQDVAESVFAPHDMSFVQWIAMLKLSEGQAQTASDLCRAMCHDNGAVTRMLDTLEERGFVSRQRSQQDRRVVELTLTATGAAQVEALKPKLIDELNLLLTDFSAAEFSELTRLLDKLYQALDARHSAARQGVN